MQAKHEAACVRTFPESKLTPERTPAVFSATRPKNTQTILPGFLQHSFPSALLKSSQLPLSMRVLTRWRRSGGMAFPSICRRDFRGPVPRLRAGCHGMKIATPESLNKLVIAARSGCWIWGAPAARRVTACCAWEFGSDWRRVCSGKRSWGRYLRGSTSALENFMSAPAKPAATRLITDCGDLSSRQQSRCANKIICLHPTTWWLKIAAAVNSSVAAFAVVKRGANGRSNPYRNLAPHRRRGNSV